jgi:cold shock CspA family protein
VGLLQVPVMCLPSELILQTAKVRTVSDGEGFMNIMIGDQNADIFLLKSSLQYSGYLQLQSDLCRQRFIKKNKFWINSQATGNFSSSPFSP